MKRTIRELELELEKIEKEVEKMRIHNIVFFFAFIMVVLAYVFVKFG